MSNIRLGCIADDFTGATDLANNLVRSGMRTAQLIDVPSAGTTIPENVDAVVVALKSRTINAEIAVAQSIAACRWLRSVGAEQIYFKYCSTFDSTPKGNIGPVLDALLDELGEDFAIATPAFPDNHRAVFMGHLFVGDTLLQDTGMRNHPLTPMTDSSLLRLLQPQTKHKVGLVAYLTVAAGSVALHQKFAELREQGCKLAIADAISNDHLVTLGAAIKGHRLVSGGSGLAIGLPRNWSFEPSPTTAVLPGASGAAAIISGSCSQASNAQVSDFIARGGSAFAFDGMRAAIGEPLINEAISWALPRLQTNAPLLIYSTAAPEAVQAVQRTLGADAAGETIENALADIAAALVDAGVGKLIVAGGETSGACVRRLRIASLRIGQQIDPGVPWCHTYVNGRSLHLALKSGNFGTVDFFSKAFALLQ